MSLAGGTQLLSERLTLLKNTRTSNGAGGGSANWTTVKTVQGRGYAVRIRQNEVMEGGRPSDLDISEFVLDAVGIDGSWRIQRADGTLYEIVAVQTQAPVTIVRGRRVAT